MKNIRQNQQKHILLPLALLLLSTTIQKPSSISHVHAWGNIGKVRFPNFSPSSSSRTVGGSQGSSATSRTSSSLTNANNVNGIGIGIGGAKGGRNGHGPGQGLGGRTRANTSTRSGMNSNNSNIDSSTSTRRSSLFFANDVTVSKSRSTATKATATDADTATDTDVSASSSSSANTPPSSSSSSTKFNTRDTNLERKKRFLRRRRGRATKIIKFPVRVKNGGIREIKIKIPRRPILRTKKMKNKKKSKPRVIQNVHELRSAVLDDGIALQDLDFDVSSFTMKEKKVKVIKPSTSRANKSRSTTSKTKKSMLNSSSSKSNSTPSSSATKNLDLHNDDDGDILPFDHEVLKIIEQRFKSNSKPGSRDENDKAHLSLSIEGGGMRGAVSAGMASAIAVLGLTDSFDSIYGSSAGSVVGAYMISRQMCIDVYTQVLTAAKSKFVSKARLASSLATNLLDQSVKKTIFSKNMNPAMNISYVLDSIMNPEKGLRPLDIEMFKLNDQKQQLRIVTSCVKGGEMETHCLGSKNNDFFDIVHNETGEVIERATTMVNGKRHGLFACLETSMTVPAATGPPLPLLRNKDASANMTSDCFDAFCYEPIPYRSAVEEGATHVLVLKTRPEGNPIGTKPGLFEKVFAPMYFDSNGLPQVAEYFENGGQQYIYAEDYLTLDEGRTAGSEGVSVPPRKILYGVDKDEEAMSLIQNRDQWKKAHLLPIAVPAGTPELSVLSVDTNEVLTAVQHGFAVAFDLLAPSTGIELNSHLNGRRVAELIFDVNATNNDDDILERPQSIAGDPILSHDIETGTPPTAFIPNMVSNSSSNSATTRTTESSTDPCPKQDSADLLERLPGFSTGKMESLSNGLYNQIQK
jgi:hypothetical protein